MIGILKHKARFSYTALLYLLLIPYLLLVCGTATRVFAQEKDFPWEMFIPAITGEKSTSELPPSKPINPIPADGAEDQSTNTIISWENGGLATSYDVYFGTDPTPKDFKGNQATTAYDPGELLNDTTYYWRIDAINIKGMTTGDVWQFSTSITTIEQNCCLFGVCSPLSTSNCQQSGGIPINAPCVPNPCK